MAEATGRIYFSGNPWPDGHAIKDFNWTARFAPSVGIWMDLHLESTDYYADDSDDDRNDDEPEDDADWISKGAWGNYRSCILSSAYWAEEQGDSDRGVLAGSQQRPLDLSQDLRLTCDELPSDPDDWPRPFGLYLLGHDACADHRIVITPSKSQKYDIEWRGRIALIYAGADKFEHEFHATITGATFSGIQLPPSKDPALLAEAMLCLRNPEAFKQVTRDGSQWLIPS